MLTPCPGCITAFTHASSDGVFYQRISFLSCYTLNDELYESGGSGSGSLREMSCEESFPSNEL
jgi:hypothetical protein